MLVPSYSLVLGPQKWTEQLLSVDLRLEIAPVVNCLRARLPGSAPIRAQVGDEATLELDGGEGPAGVFAGAIASIERTFSGILVTALDAGARLASARPSLTFENASAGTVIEDLCAQVGVETGEVASGVTLTFYVADPSRSAYQHAARLAAWSGAIAHVGADGKLSSRVVQASAAETALRYGRELIEVGQERRAEEVESFTVAGEAGAGSASAPEAFRPTVDFFAGSRPEGPSAGHAWRWEPALRSAEAARTAGAALGLRYATSRQRGRLESFLLPELRPGSVFEIQDLPEGLDRGPFWAYRVAHRVDSGRAFTRLHHYRGGEAFDPLALLGSLAGGLL